MLLLAALLVLSVTFAFLVARQLDQRRDADSGAAPAELQTQTMQTGYGDRTVVAGDFITVNYVGAHTDGTLFDSNLSQTEPYRLYVGNGTAFPGWDQGLLGMKVGERRKLTVPANLITENEDSQTPTGETIIYDVDLLEIR